MSASPAEPQSLQPAEVVAAALRQAGYDVVCVGWANHTTQRRSLVVNTTGDRWLGQAMAARLGPTVQDVTAYHTAPWDLRVVVGADYRVPCRP
ncbi:MAG: LytR C-terminal domain-containing protein [Actinomycetia bacterium]|nr:LytR C-terminal domain-containing protein [Actinomycetes bacterium]